MAAHPPPNYGPTICFCCLALILIPLIFLYWGNGLMRTIAYSFLSNSLDTFKWQWKITPQSLLSGPDNTDLKMVKVTYVRVEVMHVRMRVMLIISTFWTLSTVSQKVQVIFKITSINKHAKLCLLLIYLVSCCQKQCCLFPHSSDNIKWLKEEAQQVTTWNNWEGEVIQFVLGREQEPIQLWGLFWNDVKLGQRCRDLSRQRLVPARKRLYRLDGRTHFTGKKHFMKHNLRTLPPGTQAGILDQWK